MTSKLDNLKRWFAQRVEGVIYPPHIVAKLQRERKLSSDNRFFGAPADDDAFTAPKRLQVEDPRFYFTRDRYLDQMERADWQHCDPRLMKWAFKTVEAARKLGVPLFVHSAFRTEAEQAELVRRGVSKAPYPRSAHNIGEAVDIIHSRFAWELTPQEWLFIHTLGLRTLDKVNAGVKAADRLKLNWGGPDRPDDTFAWDPAHWEIEDYRTRIRRLPTGNPVRHTPRGYLGRLGGG